VGRESHAGGADRWSIGERTGRLLSRVGRFASQLRVARGRETIVSPRRLTDGTIRPGQKSTTCIRTRATDEQATDQIPL